MIASNVAIAKFLEARGRSGIRRVVREPERWARIVELAEQLRHDTSDRRPTRSLSRTFSPTDGRRIRSVSRISR